jgi:hypothetical protein
VLNNPLRYTDPSGEIIFTLLSLFFAPQLLPVAIGADIGWITGGIRGAKTDVGFWVGAGRGAFIGAVGGALSMVGGGTFIANISWGAIQGGFIGALDATIWGENITRSALTGALGGMAFAGLSSGFEALKNYRANYGFKTNQGVLNQYWKNNDYQGYVDFLKYRYGGEDIADYTFKFNENRLDYGETMDDGIIEIGQYATNSQSEMKATFVHEAGHRHLDWTPSDPFGNRKAYNWEHVKNNVSRNNLYSDGASGLFSEIRNSGNLHINRRVLSGIRFYYENEPVYNNVLWRQIKFIPRFIYIVPKRYTYTLSLNLF